MKLLTAYYNVSVCDNVLFIFSQELFFCVVFIANAF
jgi:hypothetical protein